VEFESELAWLTEPIGPQSACGRSLDETQALAALDAHRVFGRLTPAETEPDWSALRAACLAALKDSKDLRVLAHLAAAVIRVDSLAAALQIFPLVSTWLTRYWDEVYPRIDDDAIMRRNSLTFFADRVGIVDALRRAQIARDAQLGPFSLRDFDIASGSVTQSDPHGRTLSVDQINAALASAEPEHVARLISLTTEANVALASIEATMLERGGGAEAVPKLDSLSQTLRRLQALLAPHVVRTADATSAPETNQTVSVSRASDVGTISSRQDVVRALDAVVNYYRNSEPGSLVPVIAERAKRLVSMTFLEALEEIAPEVLEPVKKAAGVRGQSS
jgi:type VI secretion system protein ImpA